METPTTSPALDAELLAQNFQETIATTDAQTVDDFISNVRTMSSTLLQAGGALADAGEIMQKNADNVEHAVDGSMNIQVDATLEPGLNGFTYVGGTDSDITLNAELLYAYDTTQELEQTVIHEKEHNDQKELKTGGQETIFYTASQEAITDPTLFYEGGAEMATADVFGRRDDQPELYETAHDMAEEIHADHAEALTTTLNVTGDLSTLQGHVWEAGLKDGSLTMDELIHQAEETGYTNQAADVLSRYVQQVSIA